MPRMKPKQRFIELVRDARGLDAFVRAVDRARKGEPTFVTVDGAGVAVIMPAADYHDPGECCCKNCPWDGNHR